jgi:hypothetical protein
LAKIFFTDEAIEKTKQKFSCTDEAIQYPKEQKFHRLPSILENVSITAILKIVSIKGAQA